MRLATVAFSPLLLLAVSSGAQAADKQSYYGTELEFAKEAVYFVMTDRFVDGDVLNNHPEQGRKPGSDTHTFNRELKGDNGEVANVGYMGGDYQGILNNADYIRSMGFTSIWLTPIWDNPDEAFSGGEPIEFGGMFKDGGKTGYHGYWANNFYQEDEHWGSKTLNFKAYSDILRQQHGIKTVLDIVANHGSPSFTMERQQPKFGQLFDAQNQLVADHQNLKPEMLDDANPLHDFYNRQKDIAELSDLNQDNPAVVEYLTQAYLHWIEQGADAFRVDTIKHMPHHFWKTVSDKIREKHPDFFMFAESFDYNANFIAQHTLAKNGAYSVLDFPLKEKMLKVFENQDSDYSELLPALHLTHGPYANPYELTTFYDNHDMARMNASDTGFIDAHNFLFTSRGIPVIYYGSEMGFMRGKAEHAGNRNFFGQTNVDTAKQSPIYRELARVGQLRKTMPSLQRGLQLTLDFSGDTASFLRVLGDTSDAEIALVMLNKGDVPAKVEVNRFLQSGQWVEQLGGETKSLESELKTTVAEHNLKVWRYKGPITNEALIKALNLQMSHR